MIDILNITPPWPVGLLLFAILLFLTHMAAVGLIAGPDGEGHCALDALGRRRFRLGSIAA